MNNSQIFTRGSEWRKWDVHIHTPGTKKNDQFCGSTDEVWEEYISALEQTDICAFGITDYFSIDNYLRVKHYQDEMGRLQGKFIFPNVEMRITPVTKRGNPINIHVIFDPDLSVETINREFFRNITFQYENNNYSCIREDLITLGRAIKNDDNYNEEAAIKVAIENFVISHSTLQKVLKKDALENHIIVAVSTKTSDGTSGVIGHGAMEATVKEILNMSDIILSGAPSDVSYFSGQKDDTILEVGGLKPCVVGSDAHCFESIGKFSGNHTTWIKADPSFNGLKQIIFEPSERVKITDTKPDAKFDYYVIDSIKLNSAGDWCQEIKLNQNLNSIIGGRSTGKSTLLSSVAWKLESNPLRDTSEYIKRLSDTIKVIWKDGEENNERIVEYFPQNFFSDIKPEEYTNLLFQILLSDAKKRQLYDDYSANVSRQNAYIQSHVNDFLEKRRLLRELSRQIREIGFATGFNSELSKLKDNKNQLQAKLSISTETMNQYEQITAKISSLQQQLLTRQNDIASLRIFESKPIIKLADEFCLLQLSRENKDAVDGAIKPIIAEAQSRISNSIKLRIQQIEGVVASINDEIKKNLKEDAYCNGRQAVTANKTLKTLNESIISIENKLKQLDEAQNRLMTLQSEYSKCWQEILDAHIKYIDMIDEIATNLRTDHKGITLSAEISVKGNLREFLESTISQRSPAMVSLTDEVPRLYQGRIKEDITAKLDNIVRSLLKDNIPLKGGRDIKDFLMKILPECWYELKLNLLYDGDNLQDMSPGKRAFALLKLLLEFGEKRCPILIDQPEDNLDNRAIYNELVQYLREKKKERQIILVSHNPNVVVGADSEEVIVANQNGSNSPNKDNVKFQYVTGSLENSASKDKKSNKVLPVLERCGIREHVCDILEGGERAFLERERKYGFYKV